MSEGWWALVGVFLGALASGLVAVLLQKRQFVHEKTMHLLENQSKENLKTLLVEMLSHRSFVRRSFGAMRKKIGGYSKDDLRKMSHEAGAKRAGSGQADDQWWYLASREEEYIASLRRDS